MDDRVRLTITLGRDTHERLTRRADREGRSLACLIREELGEPMPRHRPRMRKAKAGMRASA